MNQIEEIVDERQKSWCIHCGEPIAFVETNRDHVPSKGLLRKPYPENLPVVEVCKVCNHGYSRDEEYVIAFLGSVLAGTTAPTRQTISTAERILKRNHKLRERIERAKTVHRDQTGEIRLLWTPEQERINRVILKNARGHAFFEYGEPMLSAPRRIWSAPLESLTDEQRAAFENVDMGQGWPEVGSRMMMRVVTGPDLHGGWIVVQHGDYRYIVAQQGLLLVRSVLFEYLATEVYWAS